ncbi:MAG: hypothetical protein N2486_03260 [Caloramator sp.]|nr:hypothetical protein [Caloramator sp.]
MDKFEGKLLNIIFIVLFTIFLLISNIGQSFKVDIFSTFNCIKHYNNLNRYWERSKNHPELMDLTSNYIISLLKNNKLKPFNNSYIHTFERAFPVGEANSHFEILSLKGKLIKAYKYGKDFFEDFKGLYKDGETFGSIQYISRIDQRIEKEIIITDLYNYNNIEELDNYFLSNGVKCVISPAFSEDLAFSSGIYDDNLKKNDKGLIKIIINPDNFSEIIRYSQYGYRFRINTNKKIEKIKFKNIYGILPGKNKLLKPLLIVSYYDFYIKLPEIPNSTNEQNITPSIILELINSIRNQRAKVPDRTIIFVFLSGHLLNQDFDSLFSNLPNGDILVIDSIGLSDSFSITHTQKHNSFTNNVINILKEHSFYISSRNTKQDSNFSYTVITCENDMLTPQLISRSGKFLLSFIKDECYNLGYITANFRLIRYFKKLFNIYSIPISIILLIYTIYILFKPKNIIDK